MSGLSGIDALILAGGLGTRLRPVLSDRPKVLAEVAGRPFLAWVLDALARAGCRRAVISTGYMAEAVEQALGAAHNGMALAYSREAEPLGTGGGLRLAEPLLRSDPVLALNGDSLVDADLGAFADWFSACPCPAGMLLVETPDTSRYGRVTLGPQGRVLRFEEKQAHAGPGLVNAGVYLLKRSVLAGITPRIFCSLERDVFPRLAEQGVLCATTTQAAFLDIGTPETLAMAGSFLAGLKSGTGPAAR